MTLAILVVGVAALVAERTLFGPLAIWQQGPDLLLVGLLFYLPRCRSLEAAGSGFLLGLLRDVCSTTRPGTYTLVYMLAALFLVEVSGALRLPRGPAQAGLAALVALQVGVAVALVGWLVQPAMALGGVLAAVLVAAAYTGVAALPMLWLLAWVDS